MIGKTILNIYGWRVEGSLPNIPKMVIIAAPHTTNWDFFFGIAIIFALRIKAHWIGKHTLFRRPFGGFMRWLGGQPVVRHARTGVVEQVVNIIKGHDKFVFGLSPEGTRKKVEKWRAGFYYIALKSKIPILLGFFDYSKKILGFGPLIEPSGNIDADLETMRTFYTTKAGKYPENF